MAKGKTMAMSHDEIFEKLQEALVDALGVDDDEVTPEAKLVDDLGAESIDFLDITFRMEKAFGIKIDQGEMFPDNVLNDATYVRDGKVTDEGMALLREQLPYADLDAFDEDRAVDSFANIFTVETLVRFVQQKQERA
jgi:acyl carrier protein